MSVSVAPSKIGVTAWKPKAAAGPTQVGFQDLAHVHTAGHAQGVQQDLHRGAVGQEGHVFLRQDLGDDALVAVPAGHLVAHGDHPLGGHVDLDHLQHAAAELVAALHRVQGPLLGVDRRLDGRPEVLVDLLRVGLPLRAADVELLDVEGMGLLGDVAVLLALDQRVVVLVGEFLLEHLLDLLDQLAEAQRDPLVALGLGFLQRGLEGLALVLGEAQAAGELLRADDDPLHARRAPPASRS